MNEPAAKNFIELTATIVSAYVSNNPSRLRYPNVDQPDSLGVAAGVDRQHHSRLSSPPSRRFR